MKVFECPDISILRFTLEDVLTTSSNPTGPIDPELPPDDDFE